MDDVAYKPSRWGGIYHRLQHNEALGAGAAGPGKSYVLLNDCNGRIVYEHQRCLDKHHPYRMHWGMSKGWALHLRRTFGMLKQTIETSQQIFPRLDPRADYSTKDMTWKFASGYKYTFGHCATSKDWEQYMSNQYDWIGFDELVQFEEGQYRFIKTRCRSADPILGNMCFVRSMSNPLVRQEEGESFHVKNPFWVRKYFVEPWPAGNKTLRKKLVRRNGEIAYRTRIYLPAKLTDNPNPEFARIYEEQLLDNPPHMVKALLDGDWFVTAGSFYGEEWQNELHVIEPFVVPEDWPIFRSMDWGYKQPGCIHWWAMDPDGNLFCIYELTFQKKVASEVAMMVKQIEMRMGLWRNGRSAITGPADTQLWEQRGLMHGTSMATVFAEAGIAWVGANKSSRMLNAQLLLSRLKDHHHGTTTPGIVFFKNCTRVISTLPSIGTSENNPDEPMDGGDDHWHDSACYACAYAARGRGGIGTPERQREIWEDEEAPMARKRGRWGYN